MTKNATYCDKHVSSRKCIFFVVQLGGSGGRGTGHNDIINVYEHKHGDHSSIEDKDGCVSLGWQKTQFLKTRAKPRVPSPMSLFKTIDGFLKLA